MRVVKYLEKKGAVILHLASDTERLPRFQIQVLTIYTECRKDSNY